MPLTGCSSSSPPSSGSTAACPLGSGSDGKCITSRPAPTAAELLKNPVVKKAMDEAWKDSHPEDRKLSHEEGGWVYVDLKTLAVTTRRATPIGKETIDLGDPPVVPGSVVVASFHTHPVPSAERYVGPSQNDVTLARRRGVPNLIRNDQGDDSTSYPGYESDDKPPYYGPDSRNYGLDQKGPLYPGE